MSAGYVPDPVAEHAAITELAAKRAAQGRAATEYREAIRRWLADPRVRAEVIADAIGVSRATVYRYAKPPAEQDGRKTSGPAKRRQGSIDTKRARSPRSADDRG